MDEGVNRVFDVLGVLGEGGLVGAAHDGIVDVAPGLVAGVERSLDLDGRGGEEQADDAWIEAAGGAQQSIRELHGPDGVAELGELGGLGAVGVRADRELVLGELGGIGVRPRHREIGGIGLAGARWYGE